MNQNNKKVYRRQYKIYGKSYRSLSWITKKAQDTRFKELLKDLDLKSKSILDFGSGLGDIIPYISAKSNVFEYIGIDMVSEFVEESRKAYKNRKRIEQKNKIKFLLRDFIKNPLRKNFDVVLSSGALNSNSVDPVGYRKKAIAVLWSHAEYALSFNMAGSYPQPRNKKTNKVYYADSLDILKYCLTLTSKIIFRHHYRRRDFTIIMFR